MKTAIVLFAAALSFAALSTNASAQKLMPTDGMKAPKIVQPTTGLLRAIFMTGSGGSSSDDAYALIGSMLSGSASPGDETEEYGDPIASEAEAAKTFDYCVIYPERCTVSQIERPTFGPHMVTFDNITGSASPGGDDVYTSEKVFAPVDHRGSFDEGTGYPGGDDIYTSEKLGGSASPGGDDIYTSEKVTGSASPGGDDI